MTFTKLDGEALAASLASLSDTTRSLTEQQRVILALEVVAEETPEHVPAVVTALGKAVDSENEIICASVVSALARIAESSEANVGALLQAMPGVTERIAEHAFSPSPLLYRGAIGAIGSIGLKDAACVNTLRSLLDEPSYELSTLAQAALEQLNLPLADSSARTFSLVLLSKAEGMLRVGSTFLRKQNEVLRERLPGLVPSALSLEVSLGRVLSPAAARGAEQEATGRMEYIELPDQGEIILDEQHGTRRLASLTLPEGSGGSSLVLLTVQEDVNGDTLVVQSLDLNTLSFEAAQALAKQLERDYQETLNVPSIVRQWQQNATDAINSGEPMPDAIRLVVQKIAKGEVVQ